MDSPNLKCSAVEAGTSDTGLNLLALADSGRPAESAVRDAPPKPQISAADNTMLDKIEREHFEYFRAESDPVTGLTRDRNTPDSSASIAATGFSLTAWGVAASRGWVGRDQAADYAIKVLTTLNNAPQGDAPQGTSGKNGLFYHFLDPHTGTRAGQNEVSTIDTALLMGGVLFARDYFGGDNAKEKQIRDLADQVYRRVDWQSMVAADGKVSMGWTPETGMLQSEWKGLNEGQILMLMGMGSPTHPLPDGAWDDYMSSAKVGRDYGREQVQFGPLFGHQYMQVWLDMRGLYDATNKRLGFDYFENSRRAALNQRDYAINNPQQCHDYGGRDWGLSACDGPGLVTKNIDGRDRAFFGYGARGYPYSQDDCTISTTAAAASLPFAPEVVLPTLRHWLKDRPEINSSQGFKDAFNPTFDPSKPSGWVDPDSLGIDQGPIVLMAENYRTALIWETMKNDVYLNSALNKAGFTRINSGSGTVSSRAPGSPAGKTDTRP